MKESERIKIRLRDQSEDERLFRINAGMGWTGAKTQKVGRDIVIRNAFPFHAAPKGWNDICGWESVEITPDMVGQKVAVFKFIEVKLTGKLSPEQVKFREILERMGGKIELIEE